MSDFDKAIEITLKFEGGLSDHVSDKGGLTKYGISLNSYPGVDVKNLTLEKAKEIYKRDYWTPCRCDELPWPLNLCVLDYAINSGKHAAIMALQYIVGLKGAAIDGKIGTKTLSAIVLFHNLNELTKKYLDYRLERLINIIRNNPSQKDFLLGWMRRINELYFIVGQSNG